MANPQEHQLTYVLGDTLPASGHTLEIAPGIRWLRMGLPFALDHINLWLVRDELDGRQGWTIVDCGISNDATRSAWERIFAEELDGLPVLRVIVTHMHPDHIGLAHWLTERWSTPEWPCRLWISLTDWNAARMASISTTGFGGEAAAAFFASHGVTDLAAIEKVRLRGNYYSSMVPAVPQQFRRMMEGQRLTMGGHVWTCHAGHGHAPEHISLHCEALGVLISGDMVLPRISTNISVIDIEPEGDPLPLYLASIERMRKLPADTLVLPSHGKPFRGLHPRITQLHQLTFAMGEAIAHLHALWLDGDLQRVRQADGVWRFAAV
jgi:glyoxylase-like metal-dependent hydrolase (beta-lactamase superfamily II)